MLRPAIGNILIVEAFNNLRNKAPYENVWEVGGEHMTFYKILGFEGGGFNVTVEALEGYVSWSLMGDGVSVNAIPGLYIDYFIWGMSSKIGARAFKEACRLASLNTSRDTVPV